MRPPILRTPVGKTRVRTYRRETKHSLELVAVYDDGTEAVIDSIRKEDVR